MMMFMIVAEPRVPIVSSALTNGDVPGLDRVPRNDAQDEEDRRPT